ncbi:hypothetical protein P7C70_g4283, partial [Phenoliferia sp. Uapishka_3]
MDALSDLFAKGLSLLSSTADSEELQSDQESNALLGMPKSSRESSAPAYPPSTHYSRAFTSTDISRTRQSIPLGARLPYQAPGYLNNVTFPPGRPAATTTYRSNPKHGESATATFSPASRSNQSYSATHAESSRGNDFEQRVNFVVSELAALPAEAAKDRRVSRDREMALEDEIKALRDELMEASCKKIELQQELGELRRFLSLNDTGDLSRVILALKDVNDAVDDLAFHLYEQSLIVPSTSHKILLSSTRRDPTYLRGFLEHLRQLKAVKGHPPNPSDYLLPLFKLIINKRVHTALKTFHPSFRPPNSDLIDSLFQRLSETESPRSVARWRAMTYRALQPTSPFIPPAECALNFELLKIFPSQSTSDTQSWSPLLRKLFSEVVVYQDLVRESYLSCEFAIFGMDKTSFDEKSMEDEGMSKGDVVGEAESRGGELLAMMSFGLRERKCREREVGEAEEWKVLLKARVLTRRFLS